NILLTTDGRALVADYGIARAVSASATEDLTSAGIILGTPAYMSPEQASGGEVDARSDQYSWGCILYEMLAGSSPFYGASVQAMVARHMYDQPPSLRVVRWSMPASLEAIVMRALSKVPGDRFASMEEVLTALRAVDTTPLLAPLAVAPAARGKRPLMMVG